MAIIYRDFLLLTIMVAADTVYFLMAKISQQCGHIWSLLQNIYCDLVWGWGGNPGRSCYLVCLIFLWKSFRWSPRVVRVLLRATPVRDCHVTYIPRVFSDPQLLAISILTWPRRKFSIHLSYTIQCSPLQTLAQFSEYNSYLILLTATSAGGWMALEFKR